MHPKTDAPRRRKATRLRVPWENIQITETCWLWTGRMDREGRYSRWLSTSGHRHIYEAIVGTIPAGLELDHVCRITACVNPAHLEPVTRAENMRRRYATYTSCSNGHPYDAANTYIRPTGHRDCRACIRARVASYKRRQALRSAA